jgi:hypothetical protein
MVGCRRSDGSHGASRLEQLLEGAHQHWPSSVCTTLKEDGLEHQEENSEFHRALAAPCPAWPASPLTSVQWTAAPVLPESDTRAAWQPPRIGVAPSCWPQ